MILVLTTPRTASSYLCMKLADEYGYQNLDEYFGGSLTEQEQLAKLDYLKNNPKSIVKAFAWQIKTLFPDQPRILPLTHRLLQLSEKTIFLIRKDFNAQCRSYYVSKISNHWSGEPRELEHISLNENYYQYSANELVHGYKEVFSLFQAVDNSQVIYTETIETDSKYHRPVVWDRDPPQISFDPAKLFS